MTKAKEKDAIHEIGCAVVRKLFNCNIVTVARDKNGDVTLIGDDGSALLLGFYRELKSGPFA